MVGDFTGARYLNIQSCDCFLVDSFWIIWRIQNVFTLECLQRNTGFVRFLLEPVVLFAVSMQMFGHETVFVDVVHPSFFDFPRGIGALSTATRQLGRHTCSGRYQVTAIMTILV